mmetsp:Transcript_28297/g.76425  ORF Transcript_28297/g.76425 Transcript_28297/m.76425 type:complete len:334 (+) Transcript_28297:90-1091(+)
MDHHRPSILHRPLRNGSLATKETREEQFQREQEALRRRAAVQQDHLNRLTASLYPTEETKAAAAAEAQRQLHAHQAAKLQAQMMERKMEEEQERAWAERSSAKVPSPTKDQPWHNASMYYSSDLEERAARRRYEEEVFSANMMAARQRAYEQQRQKAEEEEAARRLLAEESNFWNLGSRSERWLPPERRVHSPNGPKEPLSAEQHPPVWSWASDAVSKNYVPPRSGGIVCRSPGKQDQARPKTPWALDEELEAAAGTQQQQQQSLQQVQQRYQCRPATASYTGAKAVPWATDLDPPSAAAPVPAHGRRHVQYLPQQRDPDAFGTRVDRGIPFS